MAKHKSIYFDELTQKCRWTVDSTDGFKYDYKYVGYSTETEYVLLSELLFFLYEEKDITYEEYKSMYKKLRSFCDSIKGLIDES